MLPPNETLKDVLHYADYRTLVRAKFAAARFLHLINKYAEEFACRRSFRIWIGNTDRVGSCIIYQDAATGAPARMIPFKFKNLQSLAPACRELDAVVGFHAVEQLTFSDYTWNTPGFGGVVFEAVPMLKYAEAVELRSPLSVTSRGYSDVFVGNFMGLKELHLSLEDEGLRYFDWAFLRRESARALRLVKFTVNFWSVNTDHYAEDLVRHCVTHPRPHGAEALELDFSHDFMHPTFGRHIIEVSSLCTRAHGR